MSIVVLTAITDDELRVRLLSEGAQDYLNKPFSVAELQARVRNLVARTRAQKTISAVCEGRSQRCRSQGRSPEAVASVPEESVRTVLQTIALNATESHGRRVCGRRNRRRPARPFEVWTFLGASPEQAAKLGRPVLQIFSDWCRRGTNRVRLRDLREHPAYRGLPPLSSGDAEFSRGADPLSRTCRRQPVPGEQAERRGVHGRGPADCRDARRARRCRHRDGAAVRGRGAGAPGFRRCSIRCLRGSS